MDYELKEILEKQVTILSELSNYINGKMTCDENIAFKVESLCRISDSICNVISVIPPRPIFLDSCQPVQGFSEKD